MAELERRIDYALVVAKASEAAALEIGDMALDAAKQARRAAELAEFASTRAPAPGAAGAPAPAEQTVTAVVEPEAEAAAEPGDAGLRRFNDRADRVLARLSRLESSYS